MTYLLKKAAFVLCMCFLTQCATTPPSRTTSTSSPTARVGTESNAPQASSSGSSLANGCPLDKMQWLYASTKYDATREKELAAKITIAAQTDAATLDKMVANSAANPLEITSSLKGYVEQMSQSRVPVSDEFYKQYTSSRMTMCAVYDALRNGSIKKDDGAKVAGNAFRDIARTFEKLQK
ncbi:MAG: hypothetical protein KKG00_11095 [Bacteroidetes bacterium]|nr:hypothetical protein [Bacteroidota bacterium]